MSQLKIKNGNNWESIPAGGIGVPSGGTTGQVLQKSSNTDYATEWATKGLTLLWTNTNPTASFAAQTVSLDLSGYDAVAIVMTTDAGTGNPYQTSFCAVGENGLSQYYVYWNGTIYTKTRVYSVASTGIVFDNNSENGSTNNIWNVPVRIYGVKI